MQAFKDYLGSINKTGDTQRRIINTYKRVNDIVTNNSEDYDNFRILIKNKKDIEKWLTHNLTPSTIVNYCFNIVLAIESMRTSESQKETAKRFYRDIAAEFQRIKNREKGIVKKEFEPKRGIEILEEVLAKKPTIVYEVKEPPKVEKVVRAIPQWADSGEPILTQIKAFVQTLRVERTNEPLSDTSKGLYTSNIKTMMKRMGQDNLDFLVKDVPGVINFLNETDASTENRSAYNARLSARNFFTVAVNFLPLAKTNDPNDRVIAKDQYNQWLQAHQMLKKPGKTKEYGITWVEAVKLMQAKIKSTQNDLYKLILSLYTDTPPRRSMDYAKMLINQPDDKKSNILVFTPKVKQFIFNKYKTVNKSGAQVLDIKSPALIKVISDYLEKNPNQEYLLMRNGNALNDKQIREILRTEIGSKTHKFGIQAIRRMFATYIMVENKRSPRAFEAFAKKMCTSVAMLNNNYVQVDDDDLDEEDAEYHGI